MELLQQPIYINLAIFLVAMAVVWPSGTKLSVYADVLAHRTGFGAAPMGFLLLATATQLPEIATNSTGALRGESTLVLSSMTGGMAMQTAVLAVTDFFTPGGPLSAQAKKSTNVLQGALLILLLSVLFIPMYFSDIELGVFGVGTLLLALFYVFSIRLLWRYREGHSWVLKDSGDEKVEDPLEKVHLRRYEGISTQKIGFFIFLCTLAILGAGVLLVLSSEALAVQTGLGSSFIGVTLLASATSLPELSTTYKAARLGATTMAFSNIFGSNLIMIFLLFPADLLFSEGPLLNYSSPPVYFAILSGIVLTTIYLIGLLLRSKKTILRMGYDSFIVLLYYLFNVFVLFHLKNS